jgi:hypothetical protein
LQRYILTEASQRECLHCADILAGYFGWTPQKTWTVGKRPPHASFTQDQVGPQRYRSDRASLSRVIRSLEARGLIAVRKYSWGPTLIIELTDEGQAWLTVN